MKPFTPAALLLALAGLAPVWVCASVPGVPGPASAAPRVWRCGNEYTNDSAHAQRHHCQPLSGGQLSVVPSAGAARPAPSAASAAAAAFTPGARIDNAEQRQRDSDARAVLETELARLQAQQAELLRQYNNGEPEKQGAEARNYQKYLDRVTAMKAELARNALDMASLQRELARLGGAR